MQRNPLKFSCLLKSLQVQLKVVRSEPCTCHRRFQRLLQFTKGIPNVRPVAYRSGSRTARLLHPANPQTPGTRSLEALLELVFGRAEGPQITRGQSWSLDTCLSVEEAIGTDCSKMDALNSAPQEVEIEIEDAAPIETQDRWFDQWVTAKGKQLKGLVSSMMVGTRKTRAGRQNTKKTAQARRQASLRDLRRGARVQSGLRRP